MRTFSKVLLQAFMILALIAGAMSLGLQTRTASAQTTNLALSKPVTCSSTESTTYPCTAAVDGNSTGTRWSSAFSDPQWIYVDLGATYNITRVVLIWEAAYGSAYQIQVSAAAAGPWTNIYTTTTGNGATDDLTGLTGSGRFVRMNGTTRATAYGYSLWEFQVYGTSGTGATNTPTRTNTPGTGPTNTPTRTATPSTAGVIFYQDTDYGGVASAAHGLGDYAVMPADVPNDWMSSLKVPAGWVVDTYSDGNFAGTVCSFTADTTFVGAACNDIMSSFKIHLPYTPTPTPVGGVCSQPNVPNFGANMRIFDTSMSAATIQSQLDADFNLLKDTASSQFSENRRAHLFKPGAYSINDNVGYYTSVAGLGLNPGDVTINGHVTVDAFNASDAGNATQNFWRSAENLTINPSGNDRWAVAQAAPFRRIQVNGNLDVFPASYGWASGGYISDTRVTGVVTSASQQQWYSQNSNFGSWSGAVWNMVFAGVSGAPGASFPASPTTVLGTTPVSRDVPYLYIDGSGNYRVFLPNLRTNASGASWPNTPGTSLPMSQFYVVMPGTSAATINSMLGQNCNLFFTPGVFHVNQTININRAGTVVLGIGYPTIVNDSGVVGMQVADVDGVRIKGILFDAGTTAANAQLIVGTAGNTTGHGGNPISLQDVFFRVGGQFAGKTINSLIVNANDTLIDHTWIWRADHGSGVGWTSNTADTALVVNGNNVLAAGLFAEHYQKYEVIWNGQGGKIIFFQNEMPYDPPNQASWMNGSTNGYAAIKVANSVTSFEAWGLGSYCYFNVNPAVVSARAFEAPNVSGVRWHNLTTVSLGNVGAIINVINTTGPRTPTDSTTATVTTYP